MSNTRNFFVLADWKVNVKTDIIQLANILKTGQLNPKTGQQACKKPRKHISIVYWATFHYIYRYKDSNIQ